MLCQAEAGTILLHPRWLFAEIKVTSLPGDLILHPVPTGKEMNTALLSSFVKVGEAVCSKAGDQVWRINPECVLFKKDYLRKPEGLRKKENTCPGQVSCCSPGTKSRKATTFTLAIQRDQKHCGLKKEQQMLEKNKTSP